jgi:hypothetical protein
MSFASAFRAISWRSTRYSAMCWAARGCIQDGIPLQTAQRLQGFLLPASSLDEVLLRLGRIDLQNADLSSFENDILHDVRQTLFPQARPGGPVLAG